jgi:ABC-2 type transport system permease protein
VNIRRVLALARKEFIHLRSDWWLPAFMLVGGALELLLIGWATSRPITNLPLMILDRDQSAASREFITAIENTGTFAIDSYVENESMISQALARGTINAAIIFPPGYGREVGSAVGNPTLSVILNGAESIPATAALRAVEGVGQQLGERLTLERIGMEPAAFEGFLPSLRIWFNESLNEAYYTTPAELALMLEVTVLLFAALAFSRERELGTLEQLLVMPYSSLELMVGKALPVIAIALADFALMLGVVHFVFDVPVRGSLILLGVLAFGYLLVELGKGMVLSVMVRTQHQAFLLVMLVAMVDFMFTGYAAPVESMPEALQLAANLIPAHHWLTILRGVLLKASDLSVLWPNVLALAILGAVIGTFSFRYVRRALN